MNSLRWAVPLLHEKKQGAGFAETTLVRPLRSVQTPHLQGVDGASGKDSWLSPDFSSNLSGLEEVVRLPPTECSLDFLVREAF